MWTGIGDLDQIKYCRTEKFLIEIAKMSLGTEIDRLMHTSINNADTHTKHISNCVPVIKLQCTLIFMNDRNLIMTEN